MLTDLTKLRYEQYMYAHVLRPLGMTNSSYNQPPAVSQRKNLATGYKSNGNEVPGKYFVYPEKAAAGLWTTPTDICKYILEMQQAYRGKSSKVLNQEMVKLHVTPYKNDVAMGTFIQNRNGEKYFDHTASNEGFSGLFIGGLTNGKGAAIFVNSDDASIAAIELYRQYLKSGDNANELSKSLKNDFEYFRNAGFDHSVIKKASDTLSLYHQ